MTYTEQMNTDKESITQLNSTTTHNLSLVQREIIRCCKRIAQIVKAALKETFTEFQTGHTAIRPIAKSAAIEAIALAKKKLQKILNTINETWRESEDSDLTKHIIQFARALSTTVSKNWIPTIKHQVTKQATKIDDALVQRYDDRYLNFKARLMFTRS